MADNPIQRLRRGEEVSREEILSDVDRLLDLYKKRGDQLINAFSMKSEPHIFDLEMLRDRLRVIETEMQAEVGTRQGSFNDAMEGGLQVLQQILLKITPMLEGWREGIPQSRKAEILINGEEVDPKEKGGDEPP